MTSPLLAVTHDAEVELAYSFCAAVTRTQARNFWYGVRLLPPAKRRALCAVYAFARQVDDIADGDQPAEVKLVGLNRLREQLGQLATPRHDPVLLALADAAARLPIPVAAFDELIDGCLADVYGQRYETFGELVGYCRQVAGSIGRLSLGVFGVEGRQEAARADSLGVALQLTNILRDVVEDRRNGRVYLPAEDLKHCRIRLDLGPDGAVADCPAAFGRLVGIMAGRAERWYEQGFQLLPALDRRSAACCRAIAGIYHRLLQRIAANPGAVMRTRVSLSTSQKVVVAARCLAGARQ